MAKHKQPTDSEVRERIEAIEDERYRHAFMYQLLIAGRISEVCGRYAPRGSDAYLVSFENPAFGEVDAVLFAVKTAKRDGKLRACALPLSEEFEPWAQPLLKYFRPYFNEQPFMFAEKVKTSKRYAMWVAEKAFDGLEWPMVQYTKTVPVKIKSDQILDRAINLRRKKVYQIHFEDEDEPNWYTVVRKNVVKKPVTIYKRWKPFRSHALRKRRTITLALDYDFSGIDLALFGGWTEAQADAMPKSIKPYLYFEIESSRESLKLMKKMAGRYFFKLLKPLSMLD